MLFWSSSSSSCILFELQRPSQHIIGILSQKHCHTNAPHFLIANLFTVSCKPNMPIKSFVFFLSNNLSGW